MAQNASKLARIATIVLLALSPLVLYGAVTRFSTHHAAWLVIGWIAVRTLPTALTTKSSGQLVAAVKLPLIAIGFSALGAATNNRAFLLLVPSATQLGFAWVFATSLRSPVPLVEQFARMKCVDLGAEEIAYCRKVTGLWAVYLAGCALCGAILAWAASPAVWALFTGAGTYLLVALLFCAEYIYRTVRFRRENGSLLERALCRWLPNPHDSDRT